MTNQERRKLLQVAMAIPFGGMLLLSGCQPSPQKADSDADESNKSSEPTENKQKKVEKMMQIQFLEIVTPDEEALRKLYTEMHGVTFSEPVQELGNARTAKLEGGALISIRAPMHGGEKPVVRPYVKTDNIEEAVAAAEKNGAEIAIPKMEIPGHGTIAIVIQGGIECGLWKS